MNLRDFWVSPIFIDVFIEYISKFLSFGDLINFFSLCKRSYYFKRIVFVWETFDYIKYPVLLLNEYKWKKLKVDYNCLIWVSKKCDKKFYQNIENLVYFGKKVDVFFPNVKTLILKDANCLDIVDTKKLKNLFIYNFKTLNLNLNILGIINKVKFFNPNQFKTLKVKEVHLINTNFSNILNCLILNPFVKKISILKTTLNKEMFEEFLICKNFNLNYRIYDLETIFNLILNTDDFSDVEILIEEYIQEGYISTNSLLIELFK